MADAVTTKVVLQTKDRIVYHFTNISDGTGESAVKKVDIATLLARDNGVPVSLDLESIRWSVQGFASVRLLWDHTTDEVIFVCGAGSGYDDFESGQIPERVGKNALNDGRGSGGDGSILLTTNGGAAGSTYDITLTLIKRPD